MANLNLIKTCKPPVISGTTSCESFFVYFQKCFELVSIHQLRLLLVDRLPAYPILSSFTVTFEQPGTYEYFCAFHPGMFGQVVVVGGGETNQTASATTTTTTPSTRQPLT
jgi:hypothetical protein